MDEYEKAWAAVTAEGRPYMPANGTEGEIFQSGWCAHCTRDTEFCRQFEETGNPHVDGCEILAASMAGDQPKEWFYRGGRPICTAYTEDPACPARCIFTLELPL